MDKVLLKIKRHFSHDEAVTYLQSELSKTSFKNGELISENNELKDEIEKLKSINAEMKKKLETPLLKLTKADLKESKFIELQKTNKTLAQANKNLREQINIWRDKWVNLNARLTKQQ